MRQVGRHYSVFMCVSCAYAYNWVMPHVAFHTFPVPDNSSPAFSSLAFSAPPLRLGKCCLNAYLHQIGKHQDGLCHYCAKPETITHFLTELPNTLHAQLLL